MPGPRSRAGEARHQPGEARMDIRPFAGAAAVGLVGVCAAAAASAEPIPLKLHHFPGPKAPPELPFVHTNDTAATNLAMRELFESDLKEEYGGVHVLFLHVHAGQGIHMVDKAVRRPEDLAGLKMRIPSRTGAWVIEALGASPVG